MRDVAIISFAQTPMRRRVEELNEVEMLMPAVHGALEQVDMTIDDIGFTCSGSTDYLAGTAFSFVSTLDAVGPWPAIQESHVEMDGAWALYEAWVRLLHGDIDTALVFAFGKGSLGPIPDVMNIQNDPFYVQPLGLDSISSAALQAQALIAAKKATERDFAEVAVRSRRNAMSNPNAQIKGEFDPKAIMKNEPYIASPLRKSYCPPLSDGAVAVVLAAGDKARSLVKRPAFIRGIDHRIEPASLGARDLTVSVSTKLAAEKVGVSTGKVDVAELHAPFAHQEIILREALGLGDDVVVNPSGGAISANPIMAAGLIRFAEAAQRIHDGSASRAVAHATSGACLQHNMVAVLEGE